MKVAEVPVTEVMDVEMVLIEVEHCAALAPWGAFLLLSGNCFSLNQAVSKKPSRQIHEKIYL